MAFVYWIHRPDHTDMFSEGYIGITSKTVSERFRQHKNEASRGSHYLVHKALRKHGDCMVVDTILEGDIEYCRLIESKLRPTFNIGYNIAVGGASTTLGAVFSEETKAKISAKAKGRTSTLTEEQRADFAQRSRERVWTDESKQKLRLANLGKTKSQQTADKISLAHKQQKAGRPWLNGPARVDIWVQAADIAKAFCSGISGLGLARQFGLKSFDPLRTIIKKIEAGWEPLLDAAYIDWLSTTKQKELHESALAT